ncbi:MAG: ATP-binding protein [Salinivirgaceae bacterium]|jgi:PAS domain S-box-containing protein|nr:ATP-binding protein [Salinivirgaceae bacterium]
MSEPLSYKELENLVKDLRAEKRTLEEGNTQRENNYKNKENLYQQIINLTHEAVIVIQGDVPKFFNKAALNILEARKEDIEKLKFSQFIHPDQRGEVIHFVSQIVSGDKTFVETESKIITVAGKILPARIIIKKLTLSNNQVSLLVQIENLQEFKSKEQELTNLQKAVDFIDKHIEEGLLLLRKPEGEDQTLFAWTIEDVNGAGCKLLVREKDELIGNIMGDFIEPSIDIPVSLETDKMFDDDYEVFIKSLNRYYRFSIYPVSNVIIACKVVDITEFYMTKEQLNKNLQRNEFFTEVLTIFNSEHTFSQKYKEILERISYHFSTRRIIIFNNSLNGKQANIVYQHSIKDVPQLPEKFVMPFKKVPSWNKELSERKMILGYSAQYLPEDINRFLGDLKISNAYIFPIFVEEALFGSVLFENKNKASWDTTEINYFKMVTELMSSITSRYHYESKLLKAKEKAEEADRLKSSFLANMSHDIRIPMTAIIGFSDLLADPDLTIGEREEFVELISNSGHDLLTLIDNIVDVAKIETGQLKIKKDKYSLAQLFKELYTNHSKNNKLLVQDDLELSLDLPEKFQSIPFETDVFRFKQVLNNLIDNAIKFTDKGSIHMGVSNVWPQNIEFYIQDTGIGIAENTQEVIFERFSKIDRSYTKEYNGTGLGLAICKSLVELLGGEMRLVSYPGKGSTFYFTHPLPKEATETIKKQTESKNISGKYNWEGKTILIAEDVEQNYKFLEYIIVPTKAEVVWAKNGKEAVDYIKSKKPCSCILMDIRMPVLNGLEATQQILKIIDIPIIIQTAYTLGDEKDLALELGCVDYISKPVHADLLLKTVENYINQS